MGEAFLRRRMFSDSRPEVSDILTESVLIAEDHDEGHGRWSPMYIYLAPPSGYNPLTGKFEKVIPFMLHREGGYYEPVEGADSPVEIYRPADFGGVGSMSMAKWEGYYLATSLEDLTENQGFPVALYVIGKDTALSSTDEYGDNRILWKVYLKKFYAAVKNSV